MSTPEKHDSRNRRIISYNIEDGGITYTEDGLRDAFEKMVQEINPLAVRTDRIYRNNPTYLGLKMSFIQKSRRFFFFTRRSPILFEVSGYDPQPPEDEEEFGEEEIALFYDGRWTDILIHVNIPQALPFAREVAEKYKEKTGKQARVISRALRVVYARPM